MQTKLVIIGLPGVGKTTIFNALTRADAATGTYGAASDEPNLATVKVPDPRLDILVDLFNPKSTVLPMCSIWMSQALPRASRKKV